MQPPILNLDDVELQPGSARGKAAQRYQARIGAIAPRIGARRLGYNLTEIAPGMRAFPFHNHRANEEMFYIVAGRGEVRIGARTHPIRAGDVIACPAGGPETAHQLANTGDTDLRVLAVSTRDPVEMCEYPDTGRFAPIVEDHVGDEGQSRMLRHVAREDDGLDYWEGE